MNQERHQRNDEEREEHVEAERMILRQAIEPVLQVLPLAGEPREQSLLLDPLILGAGKHPAQRAP